MPYRTLLCAGCFTLLLGACANQAPSQKPTHYWNSSESTKRAYRQDHQQCAGENGVGDQREMGLSSDSFQAYQDCMVARGYVLKTY